MMDSTSVNVRISGSLKKHLEHRIGGSGLYENASEYIRDLIRRDKEKTHQNWDWLREELAPALYAPKDQYIKISATDVIKRNKKQKNA